MTTSLYPHSELTKLRNAGFTTEYNFLTATVGVRRSARGQVPTIQAYDLKDDAQRAAFTAFADAQPDLSQPRTASVEGAI